MFPTSLKKNIFEFLFKSLMRRKIRSAQIYEMEKREGLKKGKKIKAFSTRRCPPFLYWPLMKNSFWTLLFKRGLNHKHNDSPAAVFPNIVNTPITAIVTLSVWLVLKRMLFGQHDDDKDVFPVTDCECDECSTKYKLSNMCVFWCCVFLLCLLKYGQRT